jgi:y4mF family transcriptional regulator
MDTTYLSNFVKDNRNRLRLKQQDLAEKAGVGLRFIRDLEQGKTTLRIDKVNQVLALFGYTLVPGKELDPYDIHENHFNKNVRVFLTNKSVLQGFIIDQIREGAEIVAWKFVSNNDAIEYQATKKEKLVRTIIHREIERIENI